MPADPTIRNDWSEFYNYNDLIHKSLLLVNYISEIQITEDSTQAYSGKIPAELIKSQKSFCPVMENGSIYLRTECVEQAEFECEFETENFDISKLIFETQAYDALFKINDCFLAEVIYKGEKLELQWKKASPIGNICLICTFENGYLKPVYDAIKKHEVF